MSFKHVPGCEPYVENGKLKLKINHELYVLPADGVGDGPGAGEGTVRGAGDVIAGTGEGVGPSPEQESNPLSVTPDMVGSPPPEKLI